MLQSRAGLQGFRSEIGYQIFYQFWNWVGKITDFGLELGKVFLKRAAHPHPIFVEVPPQGFLFEFWVAKGRSLCQAFLSETVEIETKNGCMIEATHVLRRKLKKG